MKYYSKTYPEVWTEEQRAAAEKELSKEEIANLRQEWETPPDFWAAVDTIFEFELDVCASPHNCKNGSFFGKGSVLAQDGLKYDWLEAFHEVFFDADLSNPTFWCNPGFSDVLPWHQKAYVEAQKHPCAVVVVIGIPGASQEWYKFAQTHADEIIDLSPRVHFLAPWPLKQSSNNRESMLFVYRRKVVPTRPATRTLWNWKG